jgi:uncharacterized membrane protein YhhN
VLKVVLIAIVIGSLVSLLRAIRTGDRDIEIVSKTAASFGFVILGANAWVRGDTVATWLVAGLALCAIGDVLLLWKRTFDAGLWTFLAGHVAYVAAFHAAKPVTEWALWLLVPLGLAAIGALVWLWPHLGDRRLSVAAYIAVISIMVWGAVAVAAADRLPRMIALGALLFYLSDLTVARDRFVKPEFVNRLLGLPLYYAGQILIALSV